MIRTYEPGDQVKARLEISTGGRSGAVTPAST